MTSLLYILIDIVGDALYQRMLEPFGNGQLSPGILLVLLFAALGLTGLAALGVLL